MDRAIHEEHLGLEPGGGHVAPITCKWSTVIVHGSAVNICRLVVHKFITGIGDELVWHTGICPLEFITSKCVMCTCNLCGYCMGSNTLFEKKRWHNFGYT